MMNQSDVEAMLDAYALDLLDDQTRSEVERYLESFPDLAKRVSQTQATVAALGYADHATPPADLGAAVIAAALGRRESGRRVGETAALTGAACYAIAVDDLGAVLDELSADEFTRETVYGVPVLELIRHLSGVDAYVGDILGIAPFRADIGGGHNSLRDHGADPTDRDEIVARWRTHSSALGSHAHAMPAAELRRSAVFHGLRFRVRDLLIIRAFEIWTHTEDICRATARPLRSPPAPMLFTMAGLAVRLLTGSFAADRAHAGKTLRITLTGPGGGCWVKTIGGKNPMPAADADATLVADATELCRLFANRIDNADDIASARLGDQVFLDAVLARIPQFADFGDS